MINDAVLIAHVDEDGDRLEIRDLRDSCVTVTGIRRLTGRTVECRFAVDELAGVFERVLLDNLCPQKVKRHDGGYLLLSLKRRFLEFWITDRNGNAVVVNVDRDCLDEFFTDLLAGIRSALNSSDTIST